MSKENESKKLEDIRAAIHGVINERKLSGGEAVDLLTTLLCDVMFASVGKIDNVDLFVVEKLYKASNAIVRGFKSKSMESIGGAIRNRKISKGVDSVIP